jgi:hypothetical protein
MGHSTTKILEIYIAWRNSSSVCSRFEQVGVGPLTTTDHGGEERAARAAFLVGLIASELTLNRLLRESEPRLRQGVTTAGKH